MLNFNQHLEEVAGKVTSRVSLLRRLDGRPYNLFDNIVDCILYIKLYFRHICTQRQRSREHIV